MIYVTFFFQLKKTVQQQNKKKQTKRGFWQTRKIKEKICKLQYTVGCANGKI